MLLYTFLFQLFQDTFKGPGSGTATDHTIEILIMLLVSFILGYLLRYIIGAKYRTRVAELERDLEASRKRANDLEADLSTCRYEREKIEGELKGVKTRNGSLELALKACEEKLNAAGGDIVVSSGGGSLFDPNATYPSSPNAGRIDYGSLLKNDNLQVIEGVGKKVESILNGGGLKTWANVASAAPETLSGLLKKAGGTYALQDPSTWPTQAALADEGRWDDLVSYQLFLAGGKDSGDGKTDSKVEKLGAKLAGIKLYNPNDLKIIEGIGPKIEELLKADGIGEWATLSAVSVERIQGILDKAGDNYRLADPATWPQQAGLAAAGKWAELEKLQDELDGGRKK